MIDLLETNLIEAVGASLSEEGPCGRMPQHIILGRPLNQMDVAAQRCIAYVQELLVCHRQLPQNRHRRHSCQCIGHRLQLVLLCRAASTSR